VIKVQEGLLSLDSIQVKHHSQVCNDTGELIGILGVLNEPDLIILESKCRYTLEGLVDVLSHFMQI